MKDLFELVFENEEFIIINKFHNVNFHGDGLHEAVKKLCNSDVFGVHRLDKVTSGLLILAKNKSTAQKLSKMFEDRAIVKIYLAISNKRPTKKQGTIKGDMEKIRGGSWSLLRSLNNPAITRFETSVASEDGLRLFTLYPKTGKTHQLRVLMKSLGSPILGDSRYGGDQSDRTYLHAYKLAFNFSGNDYLFSSVPTGDMWGSFLKLFS